MQKHLFSTNEELINSSNKDEHKLKTFIDPANVSLPFPIHLSMSLQEKKIQHLETEIGWLHQGIEKTFESIKWQEGATFATRINPFVPAPIALGFVFAAENLLNISDQIPVFSQNYRIIMLEFSRIYHHLNVIHQMTSLLGSNLLSRKSFHVLGLAKKLQQQINIDPENKPRWNIGGLSKNIGQKEIEALKSQTTEFAKLTESFKKSFLEETQMRKKLTKLGFISKAKILSYCLTGPVMRAVGIADDLRKKHSYSNYDAFELYVPTQKNGDIWSRLIIRLHEISFSLSLIDKVLKSLDENLRNQTAQTTQAVTETRDLNNIPPGTKTSYIEAPEGELATTIVSNGNQCPYRVRLRTPSFALANALPIFLQDTNIDDAILILVSLGITGLEVDR